MKCKIDFEKYKNNKTTFSFKRFAPFALIISLLFIVGGVIIVSQSSSNKTMKFTMVQRKEISKVVYNSAIIENEEYPFTIVLKS